MSFADNIKAREDAAEVVKLCGEQPLRFWLSLKEQISERLATENCPQETTPAVAIEPMTDNVT
jgi:hypothetical protein